MAGRKLMIQLMWANTQTTARWKGKVSTLRNFRNGVDLVRNAAMRNISFTQEITLRNFLMRNYFLHMAFNFSCTHILEETHLLISSMQLHRKYENAQWQHMKGPLDTMYTISAFYMMTQWHFAYGLQGSINEPTHLGYVSQMMVSF